MPTLTDTRLILHASLDEPVRDLAPVHAWLCDVDDAQQLAGVDEAAVSADELQRANRLIDAEKRCRFLRCRAVVRSVLGRLLGVPPRAVEFAVNAHGKPCVVMPCACGSTPLPQLQVNWSHSANLLLLAVTVSGELGVDVEVVNADVDALAVAQSHFTRMELNALRTQSGTERTENFHRVWTVKEAVLKALGTGLSVAANRVSVAWSNVTDTPVVTLDDAPLTGSPQWRFHTLSLTKESRPAFAAIALRLT